ncbi:MAG TPA: serine/threonine-protein kinase [Polyangiaceae bacterium]|nr:serine/threonine-protein kinase [Polyangiaceae bacterium]
MSTEASDSIEGTIIAGKYQLVRLLGQGGMGAVYEGRNTATLKRCAVKLLLSPAFGGNTELVKRFFREAKASSIIESDHIVQVFDSGYDTELGWPYMVMEMLQGQDLERLLKHLGTVHPLAVAKIMLQATMGLAKAHEAGVVHRDIKPANLYLSGRETGDMIVKLLDFGIAKVKMENIQETSHGLTRTGSMLGTPLYMSPEQVAGASSIDASSDVWSLGIVMFELLSGQVPWTNAASLGTLMAAIIHENLPLLQDRAPWVPPELAEITHRAMSRDTSKRFRNAAELRDALAQIVPDGSRITPDMLQHVPPEHRAFVAPRLAMSDDGMLRATTRSGLTANAATIATPPSKRRSGAVLAVALGLAVFAGGGAVGYRALKQAPPPEPTVKPEPPPPPPPPSSVAPARAPVLKRFSLSYSPPDAEVTIDGAAAMATAGKVDVEGVVGATPKIVLSHRGKTEEFVVAIAEAGVFPSKIDLAVKQMVRPVRPSGGGRPSSAGPTTQPVKPAEPKPAPKQDTGLNRNVDEFGGK